MQLEAAHAVDITKLVDYVDRKEDPLKQVVRTHQHNTNSAVVQKFSSVTDGWMPEDRSTERNKKNEG